MRVAGRRRRAVAQEQSASVAAPPVAVVGRSRRRPPAAGGRGARVVPIVARRRPYSPAQSLGDKALREAAHSNYSCSLSSNLTRCGVKRGPLGRAQEYQMSTKMCECGSERLSGWRHNNGLYCRTTRSSRKGSSLWLAGSLAPPLTLVPYLWPHALSSTKFARCTLLLCAERK